MDIRKGSPTYGQWDGFILSEHNHRQLLVPKGYAHGFVTLTPNVNLDRTERRKPLSVLFIWLKMFCHDES
ncbi:hypothetical protein EfmAA610_09640 [Enterococcus faecium]|nr:hypothetical protein EfmAA610_09640 [Enterococcus faecium]